ncbi:MAG: GHMP kinase [Thermoprotei archaeon]|nr:MAG: GHMP kinase [Thermoprotei archaeon]
MTRRPLTPRSREEVLRVIEEEYGKSLKAASAPGRADFLNTHQDYKGLPVVPVAVNLRTYAVVVEELPDRFEIISLNLRREGTEHIDVFPLKPTLRGGGWFGDYFRAVVIALQRAGCRVERGCKVVVDSDVPIGGGLGSSAALEVAFLKLLDAYYGVGLSKKEVAELAFKAENAIMGIPCGRLDQYGSSYGGAILLHTRPPYNVEELPLGAINLVIADSGIRHRVADIHPRRQAEIERGLSQLLEMSDLSPRLKKLLGRRYWEPRWEELSIEDLEPYLERIEAKAADRIRFTLLMHRTTLLALKLIREKSLSARELEEVGSRTGATFMEALGAILNRQHELLRDLYEVSLPELEAIRDAMLEAGAYGAKISGAGLGGALIALVDEETSNKVAAAALEAGASKAWVVRVDEGAREEAWR